MIGSVRGSGIAGLGLKGFRGLGLRIWGFGLEFRALHAGCKLETLRLGTRSKSTICKSATRSRRNVETYHELKAFLDGLRSDTNNFLSVFSNSLALRLRFDSDAPTYYKENT